MLEKLAGKPDESESDGHAEAKMQVLHELRNMAMDMMGDKVKDKLPHMKGVEVMAPDEAGLHKGLDMAQHLVGPKGPPSSMSADKDSGYGESLDSKEPHMGSNGSPMDEAAGEVEEEHAEGRNEPDGDQGEPDDDDMYDDMSHEDIDQMIEHLKAKKQSMLRK